MKIIIFALISSLVWASGAKETPKKEELCFPSGKVVGNRENVFLPALNLSLLARVDSGAQTSSILGTDPKVVKEGGKKYLEFTITGDDNKPIKHKSLIIRQAKIKKAVDKKKIYRWVIKEKICIGDFQKEVEINIADRTSMNFKFLIGRNILEDNFLVDVSKSNLLKSEGCK